MTSWSFGGASEPGSLSMPKFPTLGTSLSSYWFSTLSLGAEALSLTTDFGFFFAVFSFLIFLG